MFLHDIVASAAYRFTDRVAVSDGHRELTFREVWDRANRLAWAMLDLGVARGDRVVVTMPNRAEFIESEVAISLLGAVRGRLNARDSAREWAPLLADLKPSVVICAPDAVDKFNEIADFHRPQLLVLGPDGNYEALLAAAEARMLPPVDPDGYGMATHTSGTTGTLKAALYTNRKVLQRHMNALCVVMEDVTPESVILHVSPVTHMSGLMAVPGTYRGAKAVMMERFSEAEFFNLVEKHKVTHTLLPPTIICRITDYLEQNPRDISSLKRIVYAASPIAPTHLERAMKAFGPIFMQGYSGTESGGLFVTVLYPEDHVRALSDKRHLLMSCGRPTPFFDVRICDDEGVEVPVGQPGEIWVRGEAVSIGYWNRPEATVEAYVDGWFKTGDIATRDAEGYISIIDRKNDMIVSGGFNVYPLEIENVISAHPNVQACAIVGIPHDKWGEAVQACVVLRQGATLTLDELQKYCLEVGLASYKKPLAMDILSELPTTSSGKVSRKTLKERYWQGRSRNVA